MDIYGVYLFPRHQKVVVEVHSPNFAVNRQVLDGLLHLPSFSEALRPRQQRLLSGATHGDRMVKCILEQPPKKEQFNILK